MMTSDPQALAREARAAASGLVTVRDLLRFAVSSFLAADLVYGHGTSNELDEAAFLILASLNLPVDSLDPWLDARLTQSERVRICEAIAQRIETRKPAPYIVGQAWIGPYKFHVDERVIVPRSFLGELLLGGADDLFQPESDAPVSRVLDLCTGSGCLAILLALTFPEAEVVAADVSLDALEVAKQNIAAYSLEDQVTLYQSDLFQALREEPFDFIVSNPPYVTSEAVAAFPPEYAAEPQLAHLGGVDGLDLARRILENARRFLTPDGSLIMEIGQAREDLEHSYPDTPFQWLDTELSEGEVLLISASDLPSARLA
ncbi:MAG: 50S ribosomal protein L3 N(5)-glutamine methyltransferase [Filomicrobium sp.]